MDHPRRAGRPAVLAQQNFPPDERRNEWVPIVSPDGRDGSLRLQQDARLELARLDECVRLDHPLSSERGYWVQVIGGGVGLNDTEMREGDGAALTAETLLTIDADTDAELLLVDLA